MTLTPAQRVYADEVLALSPLVRFDADTHVFDITATDVTWEQIQALGPVLQKLRNTPPPPPFSGVRLDALEMGYYDRCLEHYLVQRLRDGRAHDDTCWIRYAENTFCVGRVDVNTPWDDEARTAFLEELGRRTGSHIWASIHHAWRRDRSLAKALARDAEGWVLLLADIPIRSLSRRQRMRSFGRTLTRRLRRLPEVDRVAGIAASIERHGWSNELARQPSASVLGYSRATGRYMAMTGRHRIAAAKYLYRQGRLDGATYLEVPIIRYAWASWLHGRPHPDTPRCAACAACR
jgi:hypothetical protein